MGRVADAAGIQFRLLNRRKGPAVRGPRTQADRKLYRLAMQEAIRQQNDLDVVEGEVLDFEIDEGRIAAVLLAERPAAGLRRRGSDDRNFPARAYSYRREEDRRRPHERAGQPRSVGHDERASASSSGG